MREREAGESAVANRQPATRASRFVHRLLVTFALRSDRNHHAIRASTLAIVIAVGFALLGTVRHFSVADFFAEAPIKFDLALRAVAHGWYSPNEALPVVIVDIDDATYRGWGSPAVTPRGPLTRLLEIVTAAHPRAVVVDIDLSWGGDADGVSEPGWLQLQRFLEQYPGPAPLVFPKRLERTSDGVQVIAASPLDELVAHNDSVTWAHAAFETDGESGAVRTWQDWIEVCDNDNAVWLPSVAVSLTGGLAPLRRGLERQVVPTSSTPGCSAQNPEASHQRRLLIGPRITGDAQSVSQPAARSVSASLLLDTQIARNDEQLFADRVVFIGATHAGSGDEWLTPSGVLPGVELLANTVRYLPDDSAVRGPSSVMVHRAVAILLFGLLVVLERRFRGMVALVIGTACMLAVVAVGLALFDDLAVLDSVEAAILLVILYKALETVLEFVADCRSLRSGYPRGWKGAFRTMGAACLREPEASRQNGG